MALNEKLNLTMLCDFYELTMGNGYFEKGYKDKIVYFDLFFRRCPDGGGFAIAAGLFFSIPMITLESSRYFLTSCAPSITSSPHSIISR